MTTLLEKLADSVSSWGATLAYGEKVTLGSHELVPVALVGFGFGGGEGSGDVPDGTDGATGRGEGAAAVAVATRCRSAPTSAVRTG